MLGWPKCPKASSRRCVFIMWYFVSIIMSAVFSGNLVAYLSIKKVTTPINYLTDLLLQTQYRVAVTKGTNMEELFRVSSSTLKIYVHN